MTGIPSWARVGAKVVWADVSKRPGWLYYAPRPANSGEIVRISSIIVDGENVEPCLVIEGWPNRLRLTRHGRDLGWRLSRFRPLIPRTQEQDIAEHFGRHLHQKLPERA